MCDRTFSTTEKLHPALSMAASPVHSRSHSNFTRSANENRGLGEEEVGRITGLGGGGRLCYLTQHVRAQTKQKIHTLTYMLDMLVVFVHVLSLSVKNI